MSVPLEKYIDQRFEDHQRWLDARLEPLVKTSHTHAPRPVNRKTVAVITTVIVALIEGLTRVLS